jgi:hypothetical protein
VSTPQGTIEHLVGAGRDHVADVAAQAPLEVDPLGRGRVGVALVPPLHRAERVERLQHRHRGEQARRGLDRRQAAHPEVGVDDIGPGGHPAVAHDAGEHRHVREQLVLGEGLGRAGGHVDHVVAVRGAHPLRQRGVVAAGVDGDVVPALREPRGEGRHVHVLPPGVHPADGGERARVLADQVDPHRVTSPRR